MTLDCRQQWQQHLSQRSRPTTPSHQHSTDVNALEYYLHLQRSAILLKESIDKLTSTQHCIEALTHKSSSSTSGAATSKKRGLKEERGRREEGRKTDSWSTRKEQKKKHLACSECGALSTSQWRTNPGSGEKHVFPRRAREGREEYATLITSTPFQRKIGCAIRVG